MTWCSGRTHSAPWLADLSRLKTRMRIKNPTAGMGTVGDPWYSERLRRRDQDQQSSGRLLLTAGARDGRTGRLVGFTELSLSPNEVAERPPKKRSSSCQSTAGVY